MAPDVASVNRLFVWPAHFSDVSAVYVCRDDVSWLSSPDGWSCERSAELHNVKEWALANNLNLKLNLTKSQEIIFTDQRRKTKFSIPDEIPLLQRVQIIKILGVTFTSSLSNVARTERHSGLCTNSVRTACPAQAWVVRPITA